MQSMHAASTLLVSTPTVGTIARMRLSSMGIMWITCMTAIVTRNMETTTTSTRAWIDEHSRLDRPALRGVPKLTLILI